MDTARKIFSHLSMAIAMAGLGLMVSAVMPKSIPEMREHFDEEYRECIYHNREGDRLRGYPGSAFDEYFAKHGEPLPYIESDS